MVTKQTKGGATITSHRRQEIRVDSLGPPISHYTDAVRCGDFVFISGAVACDAQGRVVGKGDVEAQATKVFENIAAVLDAVGLNFSDIAKVTVYLVNIEDRARINPVRQRFFGEARPASTLVAVSWLVHPDLLVEVDAVAYAGGH